MKKYLFLIFSIFAFTCAYSADKIVLFSRSNSSHAVSGAYNGARDAAKISAEKYSRSVEIEYVNVGDDLDILVDMISKSYIDGAKGIILYLSQDTNSQKLAEKINELASKNFPICLAGAKVNGAKPYICVRTDTEKAADLFNAEVARLGGKNTPLFCVLNDENSFGVFGSNGENFFKTHKILKRVCTEYYSIYAKKNYVEIMRFDDYGLVLFSASLLSDLTPIVKDFDRRFVVCLQAAPFMISYFKDSSVNVAIFDDSYGFGYCIARDICQKLYSFAAPKNTDILLAPLVYRSSDYLKFVELWKIWMRH